MSDTPRTDVECLRVHKSHDLQDFAHRDFANELERENAELRTALTDSLGPTLVHCIDYQLLHKMPEMHPVHAELIARIKRLAAKE